MITGFDVNSIKNGLLKSLIAVFIVGGCALVTLKSVHATVIYDGDLTASTLNCNSFGCDSYTFTATASGAIGTSGGAGYLWYSVASIDSGTGASLAAISDTTKGSCVVSSGTGFQPATIGVNSFVASGGGFPCNTVDAGDTLVASFTNSAGGDGHLNTDINGHVWVALTTDSTSPIIPPNTTTHIISMTPEDGTTTTSGVPVNFSLHAYINPDDFGTFSGVKITFHNIDQNVLLLSALSPDDIFFFDRFQATSTGDFLFSSSTILADGDYRVTAELEKTTLFGVLNPFAGSFGTLDQQSHQFIVGTETFIGHLSQSGQRELSQFYASSTATTSSALAATCSPLGAFSIRDCLSFLFIPDAGALNDTIVSIKTGILNRIPWGYAMRLYNILSGDATTTLPTISYNFGSNSPLTNVQWNIDPNAMFAAGGTFLDSIHDSQGNNVRDVFAPIIKLLVGVLLVWVIISDLTGSHSHVNHGEHKK